MRIILASDSFLPQINGVADTAARISQMLLARGHDVRILAPGPGSASYAGVPVGRFPSVPLPVYPQIRAAVASRSALHALRALRLNPPDAMIVLTPGPVGLALVAAAHSSTRVVHVYTTDIPHYLGTYGVHALRVPAERTLRWLSNRAAVTLCPTDIVRRDLERRGWPRLAIWGRGVDTDLFQPGRATAEMRWRLSGSQVERPLVLYVGRLAREKRVMDLYEAARLLPGVRFALVGDGPQRDYLERRFAAVPSVFTGFLRGIPLATAFASADLFVFPSDSETFGQVVLQAMASALPAVVVSGTAPSELVRHGVDGLHVPTRSPQQIADAIRTLSGDSEMRSRMARAARNGAARFSWSNLMDSLEGYLSGRLDPAPGPATHREALGAR